MDHNKDKDRDRRENDPDRARSSREERGRTANDVRNRKEDLGRAQSEGNLGNERTRGRGTDEDRLPDE